MAVTAGGTPYVESTDLVATYPATSLTLANKVDTKVDYALPVNAQTGTTYTFVLADGLRLTTASNAAASTYTIPPQSSVVWLANSVIRLVNYGAGVVTVDGGVGVTVTNAAKTLAQFESAALVRTGSNAWTLVPFSGGVSAANFSDAATGTYSSGGFNYKYKTYTGSGTLTTTTAGFADILVVAGAGGGGNFRGGGGGAGGHLVASNVYLPVGTLTVTVGAGGAGGIANSTYRPPGAVGAASRLDSYYAVGGGGGAGDLAGAGTAATGFAGGSGGAGSGGGGGGAGNGGAGTGAQGNNGGNGSAAGNLAGGGGGGAGAVGTNAGTNVGGNGGAGLANAFTGTSVTRAGGGGGGTNGGTAGTGGTGGGGAGTTDNTTGTAGTANTGGGGGGGGFTSGNGGAGGAGGSGIVIIRVKV